MDVDGKEKENHRRVQVRFVTKLQFEFNVPPSTIAIPTNLTRFCLSGIVNGLLSSGKDDWITEPFDFLIEGEPIRMPLEEFLIAKGISAERILEIEYIKAVVPRKEEEHSLHDDWVSSVDGSNSRFILTGSYDGLGRVWKAAGVCTHVLEGHKSSVTSVCNVKSDESGHQIVATASKDTSLRLFKFDAEETRSPPIRIQPFKILQGHIAAVQCVAAEPSGDMIASGSWDYRINLWNTDVAEAGDTESIKKRKMDSGAEKCQSVGKVRGTLIGHRHCVSSVIWPELGTLYSASWDHSILRWDVESGLDTFKLVCGKEMNCIDIGGESSALIAAVGTDPVLRVWDPRMPGTSPPIYESSSQKSRISSCKWHAESWYHLATASYDGKVMLWDLRTDRPLSVIEAHDDKVLSVGWWKSDIVISGGADSKLCISS